jgi:thymidine phosphorylase
MKAPEDADALATACVELADGWGRRARAAVTDMSQPLGEAVGNALDVMEAVEVLKGERPGRLTDLTVEFAAAAQESLLGRSLEEGQDQARAALSSGRAAEAFLRMVEAQGGDPKVVDDPGAVLPRAEVTLPIRADRGGYLARVDAEAIGRASVTLGAGRMKKGDPVDPAVGIVFTPKVGDRIEEGDAVGEVHARAENVAAEAGRRVLEAVELTEQAVDPLPLVYRWHGSAPKDH